MVPGTLWPVFDPVQINDAEVDLTICYSNCSQRPHTPCADRSYSPGGASVHRDPKFMVAWTDTRVCRIQTASRLVQPFTQGSELCVPVADVADAVNYTVRSASRGLLNFPRCNTSNYGRRAFCFAGPYVWNSLPEHIRQSTPIAVFKRSLKTFLLQQISHLAH